MVAAINQRHVHRQTGQTLGRVKAGKATAHYDHTGRLAGDWRWRSSINSPKR